MNGLIQKSGYIRPGSGGGHYAEYIATRDGVEMIDCGKWLLGIHGPSVPALMVCSLQMALRIWSTLWKRSIYTLVRYGPSSIL